MENIRKIDDKLYGAIYDICSPYSKEEVWNEIKDDKSILKEAIKVERDKFDEGDILKGIAIANCILRDYNSIDKDIYQELVNTIYSNKDIARCVIDGYSNGGNSYLLMTLWNFDLKLTEDQKAFAVDEAMNKIGTVRNKKMMDEYREKLDMKGITDDITVTMDLDCSINPVGAKTANMYMADMFTSLSNTQAHGSEPFDIRYWILRNSNWTKEEKAKLVNDFYVDDEDYEASLNEWEWSFLDEDSLLHGGITILDKSMLCEYTMRDLVELYDNNQTAMRVKEEVDFFKLMHKLRPTLKEIEYKVNVKS